MGEVPTVGIVSLAARVRRHAEEREERIRSRPPLDELPVDDGSRIWVNLRSNTEACIALTGFSPPYINALSLDVSMRMTRGRGRGASLTPHDAVCVLLLVYRTGRCPGALGTESMPVRATLLNSAVKRVRSHVHTVLMDRHVANLPRPMFRRLPRTLQETDVVSTIALSVDCTPIPIFRPNDRGFEEAKIDYDAHHNMYARKLEVAVLSTPPHVAVMWSKLHDGSEHDFSVHASGECAPRYSDYLRMTPSEEIEVFGVRPEAGSPARYWAIVCDSGYLGELAAPVEYKRVATKRLSAIRKLPLASFERLSQEYYKRIRVRSEQFHGRAKKQFALLDTPYPYSKDFMQIDVDNCVLLTNENIRQHALTTEDGQFFRHWMSDVCTREAEKKRAHNEAQRLYMEKRRRLIDESEELRRRHAEDAAPSAEADSAGARFLQDEHDREVIRLEQRLDQIYRSQSREQELQDRMALPAACASPVSPPAACVVPQVLHNGSALSDTEDENENENLMTLGRTASLPSCFSSQTRDRPLARTPTSI